MFYSLQEIIDDINAFEGVDVALNFPPEIAADFANVEFVCLYSERYGKPLSGEHTVDDLKMRMHEFVCNKDENVLSKKRDRDPDPNAAFTLYKCWDNAKCCDVELHFLGTANSVEEANKFFESDHEGMLICVYSSEGRYVQYFHTTRH